MNELRSMNLSLLLLFFLSCYYACFLFTFEKEDSFIHQIL